MSEKPTATPAASASPKLQSNRLARDLPPVSLPPRGLSRVVAAAYVGVSPSLFGELATDGRMPRPKRIHAPTLANLLQVDLAFAAPPSGGETNPRDLAAQQDDQSRGAMRREMWTGTATASPALLNKPHLFGPI